MTPVANQFARALIERMDIQPRDRILDAGSGDGWLTRELAPLVPEGLVVGLDSSSEAIHTARSQSASVENVMFLWAEAENIPWQGGFFSRVICFDSLPYFADPQRALAEFHRVLSPGATLWVLNDLPDRGAASPAATAGSPDRLDGLGTKDYRLLLQQCGFQDISLQSLAPLAASEAQNVRELSASLITATKQKST